LVRLADLCTPPQPRTRSIIGGLAFLLASGFVVSIGELSRRRTEALRLAQGELEERVEHWTRELREANQSLGELTGRLLQLQDDERRRIARELHDSVGQTLAALSMNLSTVGAEIERLTRTASTVAECCLGEGHEWRYPHDFLPTASALARRGGTLIGPPLVHRRICGARQGEGSLEFPDAFERLSSELETAIFRLVQECLTNIHRHSGSTVATVRIRSATDVWIEVGSGQRMITREETRNRLIRYGRGWNQGDARTNEAIGRELGDML
jgi:hypothetical protein